MAGHPGQPLKAIHRIERVIVDVTPTQQIEKHIEETLRVVTDAEDKDDEDPPPAS
jgi:hypothetical protein